MAISLRLLFSINFWIIKLCLYVQIRCINFCVKLLLNVFEVIQSAPIANETIISLSTWWIWRLYINTINASSLWHLCRFERTKTDTSLTLTQVRSVATNNWITHLLQFALKVFYIIHNKLLNKSILWTDLSM